MIHFKKICFIKFISGAENFGCKQIEELFLATLDKYAPQKKRLVRANNSPLMTDEFYKAIMVRSMETMESRTKYKKQRNFCVSLLRKTKKKFYENLNPNLITDNKKFWKQVKPFFSDKTPLNNNIILLEDNKIVSDNTACAEILNTFFSDSVNKLDINRELFTTKAIWMIQLTTTLKNLVIIQVF